MGLATVTAVASCLWIILWALGMRGFDALLLPTLIILIAATVRIIWPALPGNKK